VSSTATQTPVEPKTEPAVASFLTDLVGDVNRPRRALPSAKPSLLAHFPGETGLLIGVRSVLGVMRRGNDHFLEQVRRFGPVHRMQMGVFPLLAVADPELVLRVVRNDDGAFSAALGWRTGLDGIDSSSATIDAPMSLDAEPHRLARRLLQPAFNGPALASYLEMTLPRFERVVEEWIRRGRVAFKPEIRRMLAIASARIFVGIDDDREGEMLDRALADIWGAQLVIVRNRILSARLRRAQRSHRRLRETLRARVGERRANGGKDLFSRLCSESGGPSWLDDDALVRLFLGVMLGAFDTTSSAMASMGYLLAKHPDWQERLRQEALALGPQPISYDDTKRLEATDRVWRETLRLFPVAPDVPRVALRGVDLGSWQVPAGAGVFPLLGAVMHDASWWTDPQRFDPDRFTEARAEDKKHKGLFLPFGAGVHACIGAQLANLEVKAFWHTMLTRCRFRLEPDYEGHHRHMPLGVVSGDVAIRVERAG
jgi:cytochrome P450